MKTPLQKQEKELQAALTGNDEQKAYQLLLLAELKYWSGDRQQAVKLVHESLDYPWNKAILPAIAEKFVENCLEFCNVAEAQSLFMTKKQSETHSGSMYELVDALLRLTLAPPDQSDLHALLRTVLDLKEASSSVPTKRLVIKQLLYLDEPRVPTENKLALIDEYEELLRAEPTDPGYHIALLQARLQLDDPSPTSVRLLERVHETMAGVLKPYERAQLNLIKGLIHEKNNCLVEAMRSYEAGLRHARHLDCALTADLSLKLARLYGHCGLVRQAFREIEAGLYLSNLNSTKAIAFRILQFRLFRQSRKFNQARRIGQIILKSELTPEIRSGFLVEFAQMLVMSEEYSDAESLCAEVQTDHLAPDLRSDYYYLMSQLHIVKEQKKAAIELLNQSIMLTTDQSDRIKRKLELGQLYHDLGLYDEGVQTLKEVTTEFPETDEGQHAIADMKKLRTELEGSALDDVVTISHKKRLLEDLSEKIGEKSLFERLHQGLQKTRDSFVSKLEKVLNQGAISDDVFDEVEETLILADVGFETTNLIMTRLRKAYKEKSITSAVEIKPFLIAEISTILSKYQGTLSIPAEPPLVIMMIGVNGVGKTTTIAKLAYMFQQEGRSVLLAAADTFRAGAIEQISEWGNRLNTDVVKHTSGSDPSAVAYDAIHAAKARSKDVLIIDTAGRLHTKVNLMEELKKIRRIIGRELGRTPDETLLVLDATNGQNAISQAKIFKQDLDVSGIILTKLDGTAKGGIIISIANELDIPVKFIGVGEKMYDLRPFHAQEFLEALFGLEH